MAIFFLIDKLWGSATKLITGDIVNDLILAQVLHIRFIGKVGVVSDDDILFIDISTEA
ncbi:MAG: hypothetical protein GXP19_03320 [Gammaproteobacteria bacterium]|nr:hypothetical protein [Gammaproteobacteria bacterium]